MDQTTSFDMFLNTEEAAEFLKVKISTIYAWVHRRLIPYRKHGSRTVFSKNDLTRWSEARIVTEYETISFARNGKRCKNNVGSLTTDFDEEAIRTSIPKRR